MFSEPLLGDCPEAAHPIAPAASDRNLRRFNRSPLAYLLPFKQNESVRIPPLSVAQAVYICLKLEFRLVELTLVRTASVPWRIWARGLIRPDKSASPQRRTPWRDARFSVTIPRTK